MTCSIRRLLIGGPKQENVLLLDFLIIILTNEVIWHLLKESRLSFYKNQNSQQINYTTFHKWSQTTCMLAYKNSIEFVFLYKSRSDNQTREQVGKVKIRKANMIQKKCRASMTNVCSMSIDRCSCINITIDRDIKLYLL